MTSLTLFFVGSVLLINGLAVLGRIDTRSAAPINLFVGAILVFTTFYVVMPVGSLGDSASLDVVIGAVGFLLFAFAYLYVGIGNLAGQTGTGFGWYCGWSALVAAFLAVTYYTRLDDPRFGMLWVLWTVLFSAFFLTSGLGLRRFDRVTGWITVTEAFITTTIPGALLLLGRWDDLPVWVVSAVGIVAIVAFAVAALRSPAPAAPEPTQPPTSRRAEPVAAGRSWQH